MKRLIESARFPRELGGWALRGVLCAVSSFWWAQMAGFSGLAEITGMVVGIAFWVVVFAFITTYRTAASGRFWEQVVAALKIGAWLKIALSAAGWALFAACSFTKNDSLIVDAGLAGVLPDCLMGVVAVRIVGAIAGSSHPETLDSVGWTSLITIVDGALFALVIGALAATVLLWWGLKPVLMRKLKLSPARSAG